LKSWSNKIGGANRFNVLADFNNEAVLDRETGLVWERTPVANTITLDNAISSCRVKFVGGRAGWHLPSLSQLGSLVDPATSSPPKLPSGHPFNGITNVNFFTTDININAPGSIISMKFDTVAHPVLGTTIFSAGGIPGIPPARAWCVRGGDGVAIAAPANSPFQEVTVANTPKNPVPTTDVGVKRPFASLASSTSGKVTVTSVGQGKIAVIETITARAQANVGVAGGSVNPSLHVQTNNSIITHEVGVVFNGQSATQAFWTATHAVRLYADPLSVVQMSCPAQPGANQLCIVSISGYLVDLPS
jgi:hypothetical protein